MKTKEFPLNQKGLRQCKGELGDLPLPSDLVNRGRILNWSSTGNRRYFLARAKKKNGKNRGPANWHNQSDITSAISNFCVTQMWLFFARPNELHALSILGHSAFQTGWIWASNSLLLTQVVLGARVFCAPDPSSHSAERNSSNIFIRGFWPIKFAQQCVAAKKEEFKINILL